MAAIDVTDIVTDPDFQSEFTVTSTTRVTSSAGVGIDTVGYPVPQFGVVIPSKSTLVRQADGTRLVASIDIYTQCKSITDGYKIDDVNSVQADIVTWNNRQYTVCAVEDWSDYGQGYIHVAADLLPLAPPQSIGANQ